MLSVSSASKATPTKVRPDISVFCTLKPVPTKSSSKYVLTNFFTNKTYFERECEVKYINDQKEELTYMMNESALSSSQILNTLDNYKTEAELWEKSKTINTMTSVDRSNRDVDKVELRKDGNKYYATITYHTTNPITKITTGDEMKVENLIKGLVITVDDGKVSSVVEHG